MPVYFDHNATTPLAPEVLEAMLPYLRGPYANASSLHRLGRAARDAVEQARVEVAELLEVEAAQVIWTSGGTEANNLVIKGLLHAGGTVHYGATEHPAVMECAESLAAPNRSVRVIPVAADGQLSAEALGAHLARNPAPKGQPVLVAIMAANNETGVLQDLPALAAVVHQAGALLHVDAVQAAGKMIMDVGQWGADFLSLSAHKLYGPKGVGVLVRRAPVDLQPLHHGGAQEGGVRGGTENVPAIVGFGAAARLARDRLAERMAQFNVLRHRLEQGLRARSDVTLFAPNAPKLPNTVQFAVAGWAGETLLMALDRKGYCVSSGSACASGHGAPSHVLIAMGVAEDIALGAIRVSFGVGNTVDEVEGFLAALVQIVGSPR